MRSFNSFGGDEEQQNVVTISDKSIVRWKNVWNELQQLHKAGLHGKDGRSRAGWRRREHACQPSEGEGTACSKGWKVLRNYETSTYIEELATKRSAWWEDLLKVGIKRIVSEINNVLKLRNASVKQESVATNQPQRDVDGELCNYRSQGV